MTLDIADARRRATEWLKDNNGHVTATRETAINEEVMALDVLDLAARCEALATELAAREQQWNKEAERHERDHRIAARERTLMWPVYEAAKRARSKLRNHEGRWITEEGDLADAIDAALAAEAKEGT